MLQAWNAKVKPYLRVVAPDEAKNPALLLRVLAGVRSNLASAGQFNDEAREEMKRFNAAWDGWRQELARLGYDVHPEMFGTIASPAGKVIYTASPRVEKASYIAVLPGLKSKGRTIAEAVTVCSLPADHAFPASHPWARLPFFWRGLLAETDLFLWQLEIHHSLVCGIEALHKTELLPFSKNRDRISKEVERRQQSLADAVMKKASDYQIATNYSRVEECLWAIFHDDGRPPGYSFFDMIRRRIQEWRPYIQREHKIAVRDFIARRETVAAIHKLINGMVVKKQAGVAPGMVVRQLRPAMTVQENGVSRVLSGRVVST